MILGLWDIKVGAIIEANLGEDDTYTYKYNRMTSLLVRSENIKKDKHSKHCHDQHNRFLFLFFQWTEC